MVTSSASGYEGPKISGRVENDASKITRRKPRDKICRAGYKTEDHKRPSFSSTVGTFTSVSISFCDLLKSLTSLFYSLDRVRIPDKILPLSNIQVTTGMQITQRTIGI